jgi:hypothetical protein
MRIGLHVKCLLFLSEFNETHTVSRGFRKNAKTSNFMKIRPVRAELFHAEGWTNRQTEKMKPIINFRKFAKAPK